MKQKFQAIKAAAEVAAEAAAEVAAEAAAEVAAEEAAEVAAEVAAEAAAEVAAEAAAEAEVAAAKKEKTKKQLKWIIPVSVVSTLLLSFIVFKVVTRRTIKISSRKKSNRNNSTK